MSIKQLNVSAEEINEVVGAGKPPIDNLILRINSILFNNNGYINTTGNFVSNASYRCTNFVLLSDKFDYNVLNEGASAKAIVYFDVEQKFISYHIFSTQGTKSGTTDRPQNAVYAKFTCTLSNLNNAYVIIYAITSSVDIFMQNYALMLSKQINNIITINSSGFTFSGYINTTGGFISNSSYRCTDFIFISDLITLSYTNISEGASQKAIVYFDINKQFISYEIFSTQGIKTGILTTIPINAIYARFSITLAYLATANIILKGISQSKTIIFNNINDEINNLYNITSTNKNNATEKSYNVVFAGSSITWGDGNLVSKLTTGVGYVIDYMLTKKADIININDTIITGNNENFINNKLYSGIGKKIINVGSKIEFDSYGDEIHICQTILRTSDYAEVIIKADNIQILKINNKNNTYDTSIVENFVGDGNTGNFKLSNPYTFNHVLTINDVQKNVVINTGGISSGYPWGTTPPYNAVIVRSWDNTTKKLIHELRFHSTEIPSIDANIQITYDKGKIICYEKSTCGQTINNSTNESVFGVGGTNYDPLNPGNIDSGMEYISVDNDSFLSYKFEEKKLRHYSIEITNGVNPYFIFNFATTKKHIITNAAIGGYTIGRYLNNPVFDMDWKHFFKFGKPDILFLQPGLGDDSNYKDRKVKRIVEHETELTAKSVCTKEVDLITYIDDNDFTIRYCTGMIDSITETSLISSHIIDSNVSSGDTIRIGNYYGDNRQVAIREISSVNLSTGEITWEEPLIAENILNINSISDLVGKEISVRDLSSWFINLQTIIQNCRKINPDLKIILLTSENSNYFFRQSWGYQIMIRKACEYFNNLYVINVEEYIEEWVQSKISGTLYQNITSSGVSEYNLSLSGFHQGYKVTVDGGENIYGKNCVVKMGFRYGVNPSYTGSTISITNAYQGVMITELMKLIFLNNPPIAGSIIRVERADKKWSGDLTHPSDVGAYIYGQLFNSQLNI